MNAIIPAAPPSSLGYAEIERLAVAIAKSGLFGMKTPEQAIALMMIAVAEGRHPAIAARDYDVISGKPAKKAEAMMRDFIAAGGTVMWHALTDELADATFTHPQTGSVRIDWDMKRAQTAFGKKDMYAKFPRQMLRSRVVSEGVRTLWPLATSGMYEPGEAADIPPAADDTEHTGQTIEHDEPAPPKPEPRNGKRASIAPPPDAPDSDWRKCLDYIAPALARLRSKEQVEDVGNGATCGDIMEFGPDWAKAELASLLADNYGRFRTAPPADEPLEEVHIAGEHNLAAG